MDFPKSVEGVGLVGNRFVNENPATGQIGSLLPAEWGNAITEEILAVIEKAGFTPTEGQNDQLLMALETAFAPSGQIILFAGKTIPHGYLLCNGGAVSRTKYAKLFTAIGTTWGEGDGVTTFNLPDLHRRFAEFTTSVGEVGQKIEAGLPDITGYSDQTGSSDDRYFPSGPFEEVDLVKGTSFQQTAAPNQSIVGLNFKASKANGLCGKSSTVQPASVRLLPLIKV